MNNIGVPPTVIAIDPSLNCSGVAIFKNWELESVCRIKPKKTVPDHRLTEIAYTFMDILVDVRPPAVLAIETQYLSRSFGGNSVAKVIEVKGLFQGVFLAWELKKADVPRGEVVNVSPLEAKQSVGVLKSLKSKEAKLAVLEAVNSIYKLPVTHPDEADAVAIGTYAIKKLKANYILDRYL